MDLDGLDMPMELPRTEFGVRCFQLTEDHYMNPAMLFELMSRDPDILRTGVFVGRPIDNEARRKADLASVQQVKAMLVKDPIDRETRQPVFNPEVVSIRHMWAERNCFEIIGNSPSEKRKSEYRRLKEDYRKSIIDYSFTDDHPTDLEQALYANGVSGALGNLFEILRDRNRKLIYAPNICSTEWLQTTPTSAMKDMVTNIHDLPGGPHLGITFPSIYIGSEASTFNMHIEDHAFESVNRHVAGKPKVWFFVPPRYDQALYDLIKVLGTSKEDRLCSVFLQHRHVFVDPRTLMNEGIPVFTVTQRPGDVVYVLSGTHHWGFNTGLNINEAINCASRAFALRGMISAGRCLCRRVRGLYYFFELVELFRRLRVGEELVMHYVEDRIQIIEGILRRTAPALFPRAGRAFDGPISPQQLLGPPFADMEIGKPWLVEMDPNTTQHREFWGGCDLIDLAGTDDDEQDMEGEVEEIEGSEEEAAKEDTEERAAGDETEEDEEKPGKEIKYMCTVALCSYVTNEKGQRGMKMLETHVSRNHRQIAQSVLPLIREKYDMNRRKYKTEAQFECPLCRKTRRGNNAHKRRHIESCRSKNKSGKKSID